MIFFIRTEHVTFWDLYNSVTKGRLVVCYRRFGTTNQVLYSRIKLHPWRLGSTGCTKTPVPNPQSALRKMSGGVRYHLHRVRSLISRDVASVKIIVINNGVWIDGVKTASIHSQRHPVKWTQLRHNIYVLSNKISPFLVAVRFQVQHFNK